MSSQEGATELQAIFEAITEKGWALYINTRYKQVPKESSTDDDIIQALFFGIRKKREPLFTDDIVQRGPVSSLERGLTYTVFPRIDDLTDPSAMKSFIERHQLVPKITIPPKGFKGHLTHQFSRGKVWITEFTQVETPGQGQEIEFTGIDLQESEVGLLAFFSIYMPYEVFLVAIQSLRDINGLT